MGQRPERGSQRIRGKPDLGSSKPGGLSGEGRYRAPNETGRQGGGNNSGKEHRKSPQSIWTRRESNHFGVYLKRDGEVEHYSLKRQLPRGSRTGALPNVEKERGHLVQRPEDQSPLHQPKQPSGRGIDIRKSLFLTPTLYREGEAKSDVKGEKKERPPTFIGSPLRKTLNELLATSRIYEILHLASERPYTHLIGEKRGNGTTGKPQALSAGESWKSIRKEAHNIESVGKKKPEVRITGLGSGRDCPPTIAGKYR